MATTHVDTIGGPLAYASARELVDAIRGRQIGSAELLEHYLERVDRLNPAVNAVVTLDVERARSRAAEADQATARGESLGALHGLPATAGRSSRIPRAGVAIMPRRWTPT